MKTIPISSHLFSRLLYLHPFYLNQYWALIVFLLTLSSCDSFVEVELPKSQLTSVTVFEEYSTASAALTDIYSKIRDKGMLTGTSSGLSNQLGNYTDELIPFGTPASPSFNFYNNTLLPSNPAVASYWNDTYNQIYAANSIIERVAKSSGLNTENKTMLTGEALFIRALSHFYLANLFGDIPYITETDYKKNSTVQRIPVAEVYELILSDLNKAASLLPVSFTDTERTRPSRYAIRALLARVYLYAGQYEQAANQASALINQEDLFALSPIEEVFLIGSKETIWQLQSPVDGQNTQEASLFIFQSAPPPLVALNPYLVNSFDFDDSRRSNWIKAVSDDTSTWYHPYKYKEQNFTSSSMEYSLVFRLAEQYLIRAEARAQQGDLIGAKEDLNKIRARAGLSATTAIAKEEILSAILQERQWELFTEHGHRFFDLKRFGKIDAVLSPIKPGWNTIDRLFPLPQSELSTNPNLGDQNPGY